VYFWQCRAHVIFTQAKWDLSATVLYICACCCRLVGME